MKRTEVNKPGVYRTIHRLLPAHQGTLRQDPRGLRWKRSPTRSLSYRIRLMTSLKCLARFRADEIVSSTKQSPACCHTNAV